ncbi:MAG TPA: hypothetical protein DCE42_00155, partial [Myxococcales bacterium]|nr:hypothetical protein [Myxococcales bacterium]
MLQSVRSKRPHRTLCFGRKCNVCRIRFQAKSRKYGLRPPSPKAGKGLGMRFVEAYVGAMSAGADFD